MLDKVTEEDHAAEIFFTGVLNIYIYLAFEPFLWLEEGGERELHSPTT